MKQAYDEREPVPVPRVRQCQAMRSSLDTRVCTETTRILRERGVNPEGRNLDRQCFERTNYVFAKAAVDRQVNEAVGRKARERNEFTRPELERI